jgi:hypothetical protein
MALTHRKQEQGRLRCGTVNREDRAPAPVGLRDVVLYTATEASSVAGFGLAPAQRTDRHAACRQLLDRPLDRNPRRLARAIEILR